MKKYVLYALLVVGLILCALLYNNFIYQGSYIFGRIEEKINTEKDETSIVIVNRYKVKILNGQYLGKTLEVEEMVNNMGYNESIGVGKEVVLVFDIDSSTNEIKNIYIANTRKDNYVVYLACAFIFTLAFLGGLKGVKSLVSLVFTVLSVFYILLPMLLNGADPVVWSSIIAVSIAIVTTTIVSGFNKKTLAAVLGTIGGVLVAGTIAFIIGDLASLTGISMEESQFLTSIPQGTKFDFRGLLFGSIILGSIGAVMDIGMSIASSIIEIETINPGMSIRELFQSGMNVGKDIMGTMTNTLILAYIGSSVHYSLLLMAYNTSILDILNNDIIATEIVRALAGTIGLLLAIPLTAIIAASFGKNKKEKPEQLDLWEEQGKIGDL